MTYIEALKKMEEGHIVICTSIEDHNEYCIFGSMEFVVESTKPLKLRNKQLPYNSKYNYETVGFIEGSTNIQVSLTNKPQNTDRITPLKHEYWEGTQEAYDDFYQYM